MYIRKTSLFLIIILLNILFVLPLMGHGTKYRLITKGTGIEVLYADGTPMSFAEVRIFAPGKKKLYQKGMT
ncbi:MAG: hypothetical protein KAR07_11295, partial [Spirochaetes bacterium]|nr:hypothetical protein [Spirochaetota bacterium]